MCNTLAKRAVSDSLNPDVQHPTKHLLPQELVAVLINGIKQTLDVSHSAHFSLVSSDARKLYCTPVIQKDTRGQLPTHSGLGWSKASFEEVAWKALGATLHNKPQLYKKWLSK